MDHHPLGPPAPQDDRDVAACYFDPAVQNRTAKIIDFFLKYLTGTAHRRTDSIITYCLQYHDLAANDSLARCSMVAQRFAAAALADSHSALPPPAAQSCCGCCLAAFFLIRLQCPRHASG